MISTYVYGSPHGFNFYEGIASWNDYFKSFYISTRSGKRLMVNRKDDGSTIYSFLCYEIMEKGGRPNAFFGCSVILDDYRFSPDLKVLFDWFNYLFDKIVSRGNLFFINDGGILQYKVDKFSDCDTDIEWLKLNLPNIFIKSSDISFLYYDSSYIKQNLGKVICCNIDTPKTKIIDDLKKVHWVAISPGFAIEQDGEEINISDLESKLIGYNQNILSIAVNPNPSVEDLPSLRPIESECSDIITFLKEIEKTTKDEDKSCIYDIIDKYNKLSVNLAALITKITTNRPEPYTIPTEKVCIKCKRRLSIQSFRDQHSDMCLDCSNKFKICKNCHSKKLASDFTYQVDVCDDCVRKSVKTNWRQKIKSTKIAVISVFAVVTICAVFIIVRSCSETSDDSNSNPKEDGIYEVNSFDEDHFKALINDEKYIDAFDYIISFDKKEQYSQELRDSIDNAIVDILETTVPYNTITEKCMIFTTSNKRVLSELGCDVDSINDLAANYQELCDILSRPSITQAEKNEAIKLISTLPESMQWPRSQLINNIPLKTSVTEKEEHQISFTITNIDNQGKTISTKTFNQSTSVPYTTGTFVIVTSKESVRLNDGSGQPVSGGMKVELRSNDVVFIIGTRIKLTIKPIRKIFKKVQ